MHFTVVAQRIRERRFAIATGPTQRRGDRDRLAPRTEEIAFEPIERLGARDEALEQRIGHERHALLAGRYKWRLSEVAAVALL